MATILELARKMQRGEAPPPPIGRLLGFALKVIEPGHAVFEMEADERHHNPMGTLHGGVYCDLADAAMGYTYAATGCLKSPHEACLLRPCQRLRRGGPGPAAA